MSLFLARLQVESTRLLNRFCAVLTEKRTGFNQAEADRYLADLMRPDIEDRRPYPKCLECGHEGRAHAANAGIHWPCYEPGCNCVDLVFAWTHPDPPFPAIDPKSSAASNPPGASDAGPVQDPPPAPGHPNPLPACEAGSEGSGVDSDIPQSATPEHPKWVLVRDNNGDDEYRMELDNGIIVRATVEEMIDFPYWVEQRVKAAQRCAVQARFSSTVYDLTRLELDATKRRLARYVAEFGPLAN
jgi:hypothetical protein